MSALRPAGVAADCINSANDRSANVAAWRRAAEGRTRLLYMAPERLMTERMLAALAQLPVTFFAIDEAHSISQWDPAFRPEYDDLCRLRELFAGIPIAALTATADEVTRNAIVDKLFGGRVEQFVLGFDRPNIKLAVEMKRDWMRQFGSFIARHEPESGIVYCLSRRKTEETAAMLAADGVRALPYHGAWGMDRRPRTSKSVTARRSSMMNMGNRTMLCHSLHGGSLNGRAWRKQPVSWLTQSSRGPNGSSDNTLLRICHKQLHGTLHLSLAIPAIQGTRCKL